MLNNNNTVQRVAVSVSYTHEQTIHETELQGVSRKEEEKVRSVKEKEGPFNSQLESFQIKIRDSDNQ